MNIVLIAVERKPIQVRRYGRLLDESAKYVRNVQEISVVNAISIRN